MDSEESNTDSLLKGKRRQDLQEMLTEVGLSVEYWLPKLQQHLGVSCAQALQYLEEKDLQKLKSQVQHSWEKKALEKLIDLAQSNSMSALDKSPVQMIRKRQKQAEQTLEELKDLLLEGRCRQEEAVRRKESELREVMEIPEQYWPLPEQPLSKVVESIQTQLSLTVQTLSHRQNLPDRDVVRRASGGLALQGIYKTSHQMDLIQKREELLSVPKEFLLHGPEQGTRMETREFTSSHTESMFTRIIETLGFRVAASSKGEGWGFNLEAGVDGSTHSESKETQQSSSKKTYFCSSKFSYIPLASCHFPMDQLQLSKAAFQELKTIEKLLSETSDSDKLQLLRQRTENFFLRFGSHANQGPLHLGGIYWWKATAEGFQSHQMAEVNVPFHRPQAVNGWSWYKTDNFVIDSCSTSVASDDYMILDDDRKFLFKNYRQAGGDFATWSITADLSTQPYWKWFISHFRSNLEEKYKYKFKGKGEIPNTWLQITKQDVLNDLKK
ncbi:PREDICTED: interferon-induced very large GTPase 1-like [Dipodomys ordii]|uniref:Interferon-induced very large GTPase 1-like n=1 Tax=Dipodomys ordii TaxID=10020 RepID=A0A1S3GRY8_DIPOR|nr:PREDICTED: interferon-induced very large GTPase 1-like [Dipodomys ordii]